MNMPGNHEHDIKRGIIIPFFIWISVLAVVLATSCEENGGFVLSVEPSDSTIGPNIASMTMAVMSGTRDLSLPLKWKATNSNLGYIAQDHGLYAVYICTSQHGINTVTVRDQYGAKGIAVINQVAYNTERPTVPVIYSGSTNEASTATSSGEEMTASASKDRITIENLWSDGSDFTTQPLPYGTASTTVKATGGAELPDETHDLQFSSIVWNGSDTISAFVVVIDDSVTLSYP
ncbi:MAG: hypothetical protein JXN60_00090 [Lentisphaerae bacterium]|nr:hypothetical protein [Lentisphaerota bacterium]